MENTEKKVKKKPKRSGTRAYRIIYAILSGIVGRILNITVVNKNNEPDESGYIVCANHSSGADPVALCYSFRKNQVFFMAKKELFKIPLFAQLIRVLGAFPVDRSVSDVGAVKKAVSLVKDKKCMGIFPQGHRYKGENPRDTKTKNGMALIATRTGADIVPCFIWRKGNRSRLFRKTYVIIGEKIPFESLGYDPDANGEYARITDIVFDKICKIGEDFTAELEAKKQAKAKK